MRTTSTKATRNCARPTLLALLAASALAGALAAGGPGAAGEPAPEPAAKRPLRELLDAPLLFVKRHSYLGIHIYDTYYKWRPGGGIYVIENPADPPSEHRVRPVIDPGTPGTLGEGVYTHPELSWEANRLLFCFKGAPDGHTGIFEIGIDGRGLRRLTDPVSCADSKGTFKSQHDIAPAYLPDGRIVFTTTRPNGLVPCNNTGVNTLHVMEADGSGMHAISVNNVNEFDPSVLPDGRILHGRWEYVDKTALTQQSLWTLFPDGTNETAFFANNMVHPEALLDARPVPGSPHLVAATLTPHNSPPRGSIAFIDPSRGKDNPAAIANLEHPADPTHDRGDSCEPWPLSADVVLFSGRPAGSQRNALEMIDRTGRRELVHAEADICCHSPMLVKPRPRPPVLAASTDRKETTGRFFVQDVYQGLEGVERGAVKWLRVIEETSRVSGSPGGAYNQTFLLSCALAFSVKVFLGIVPVEPDGSAYFEAPSGRALYLQALDGEGRLVQSMRTFVQAAPGVTRSCIGCHEHKYSTPRSGHECQALLREPSRIKPESWGTGFIDYPGMVQPVLELRCVRCHGGDEGFAAGLDLTGGWTEHFNLSYENLTSRRETQVTAHLIAGIDCMNGTSRWSARIFPPRAHGSGAAPLARLLVEGHGGLVPDLTRAERDILLAWIDTNGLYYGTWDYTASGPQLKAWVETRDALAAEMRSGGCMRCHEEKGQPAFDGDWFNLERPELSRILRAPLARGSKGLGLGACRERKVDPREKRVRLLVTGQYIHQDLPVEAFSVEPPPPPEAGGDPAAMVVFASTEDPRYQAMLALIRAGRRRALAAPRVDMPGAEVVAGAARHLLPPPLPDPLPALEARADEDGVVRLAWERSARTIGLEAEVHRGPRPDFAPAEETLLAATKLFRHADPGAPEGLQHYALVLVAEEGRSAPIRASARVPPPPAPPTPTGLRATPAPGSVELAWEEAGPRVLYHVYRGVPGMDCAERLTAKPTPELRFEDASCKAGVAYSFTVRSVGRRGTESAPSVPAVAAAMPELLEPVFAAAFTEGPGATLPGGGAARGALHGKARVREGALDLREGGHAAFEHRPDFDLSGRISVSCWVALAAEGQMPVVVSSGEWNQSGWFLQKLGGVWRWHAGGVDCDGGSPALGRWVHLAGTFDGRTARLYVDGRLAAERTGAAARATWTGPLLVGQYSAGPGPQYQTTGRIRDLKVHRRALRPEEAAAAASAPR
ncbi:MAG: PD40 domain-containing protein [Planctomycetes bacterium]|nr:PD40 domain-containing protein [Planctomycetota bacterium]